MMKRTDKDLTHFEVNCYTFLYPEWALDPDLEYFCSLDELADELTVSVYTNGINFVEYFARTYCAFNKIRDDDYGKYFQEFRNESERLTKIL